MLGVELKIAGEESASPPPQQASADPSHRVVGASTERNLGKLAGQTRRFMVVLGAVIAVLLLLWSLQGISPRELASPSDTSSPGEPIPQPPPIAAPKVDQVKQEAAESHQASVPIDFSQFSPEVQEDIRALHELAAEIEKIPETGGLPSMDQVRRLQNLANSWIADSNNPERLDYKAWLHAKGDPELQKSRTHLVGQLQVPVYFEELNEILLNPETSLLGKVGLRISNKERLDQLERNPEEVARSLGAARMGWERFQRIIKFRLHGYANFSTIASSISHPFRTAET